MLLALLGHHRAAWAETEMTQHFADSTFFPKKLSLDIMAVWVVLAASAVYGQYRDLQWAYGQHQMTGPLSVFLFPGIMQSKQCPLLANLIC